MSIHSITSYPAETRFLNRYGTMLATISVLTVILLTAIGLGLRGLRR